MIVDWNTFLSMCFCLYYADTQSITEHCILLQQTTHQETNRALMQTWCEAALYSEMTLTHFV